MVINPIATVVPLPAVLVVVVSEEHAYRIGFFPPVLCTPDDTIWFYSMTLVLDIICIVGVTLLIVVLWKIHKVTLLPVMLSHEKLLWVYACNHADFAADSRCL